MFRFTPLSFLYAMLVISTTSPDSARAQSRCDVPDYPYDEEWAELSANGTRRVFNVGIASLFNRASIQFQNTEPRYTWPSNQPITPQTITYINGVRREIRGCWRYHSARAVECDPSKHVADDPSDANFCPPMLGGYFEVLEEDWPNLRYRECSYTKFVDAAPDDADAPEGHYFAWGKAPDNRCNSAYDEFPDRISQSYFDSTIGGILSWDGQLTNSGRFSWDVTAELELGPAEMAKRVAKPPSLSWEQRYQYALDWVRSTAWSPDLIWMDDRKCPYTGDGSHPMTPVKLLDFQHGDPYNGTCPKAVGGAAPLVTPEFYDLVDQILIDGGWGYESAANTIENREDPCPTVGTIEGLTFARDKFDPNLYYDDVMEWREANGLATDGDVTACDDEALTTTTKPSKGQKKSSKKKGAKKSKQ